MTSVNNDEQEKRKAKQGKKSHATNFEIMKHAQKVNKNTQKSPGKFGKVPAFICVLTIKTAYIESLK